MSLPNNLGRLSAGLTADASLNIGVGVTPSGTYKFEVGTTSGFTGLSTFRDNLKIEGDGVGAKAIMFKNDLGSSYFQNTTGYTAIYAGSTTALSFIFNIGTSNYKNYVIEASGLTTNTLRTYTLPDATGTLALTSNLSSYLPLAGGTLTGALGGTTGTFSGQFSIGTTAPSWGAFTNMLNLQSGSIGGTSTTDFRIFQNMYYDGGSYRTRNTGESQRWDMGGGALGIYSAASAAANAVVTPTLKFTLLNTGAATFSSSVAIGTTAASGGILRLPFDNAIRWRNSTNTADLGFYLGGTNLFTFDAGISVVGAATFSAATYNGITITTPDVATLKMTSTSASTKNWGFATTNLAASDFGIYQSTLNGGDPINAGTARLYFSGGGNVLIGSTTDNSLKFQVRSDTNSWIAGFQNYGSGAYGVRIDLSGSTGTAGGYAFRVYTQTNDGFYLLNNGAFYAQGVYNYTSSGGTQVNVDSGGNLFRFTSSLKYKRDVIDYTNGLTELLKVQPKFYKSKNPKEGEKVFAGLIAEQIDEIGLTEFVEYNKEGQPDAVHYSAMTALLVKAIQEQQLQIKELQSQINK